MKKTFCALVIMAAISSAMAVENVEEKFLKDHVYHLASGEALKDALEDECGLEYFLEKTKWHMILGSTDRSRAEVEKLFEAAKVKYYCVFDGESEEGLDDKRRAIYDNFFDMSKNSILDVICNTK